MIGRTDPLVTDGVLFAFALLQLLAMECFLLYLGQEDRGPALKGNGPLAILHLRSQVGRGVDGPTLAGNEAVPPPRDAKGLSAAPLSCADEVSEK